MAAPFVFRKVIYLVEATGVRAGSLDELLRGLNVVDEWSIVYHMHHEFLEHKFEHAEYPNDFAAWVHKALGDDVLAEKLANLRVFRHRSIDPLRHELARLCAEHLMNVPEAAAERSPMGLQFYFRTARPTVMDCHRTAASLDELLSALASVQSSSLYFHMFETRFLGGAAKKDNDFAEWIANSLGDEVLARQVAELDPYMFSLEECRGRLMALVQQRIPASSSRASTPSPRRSA